MAPSVTVIVPVYNSERFVERCVRSLLAQTHVDMELVLVDDASTDESMKRVRALVASAGAWRDRVRILSHEANRGCAAARNTGLAVAHGEYVLHVDSDDNVEPVMLVELLAVANATGADIVVADWWMESSRSSRRVREPLPSSGQELAANILAGRNAPAIWNKLVRRSLYVEHRIEHPAVGMYEDLTASVLLALAARAIAKAPGAYVHYVTYNPSSATKDIGRFAGQALRSVEILEDAVRQAGSPAPLVEALLLRKAYTKALILGYGTARERKAYLGLYPEASHAIANHPVLPWRHKVPLLLAARGAGAPANLLISAVAALRALRGRLERLAGRGTASPPPS